MLIEGISYVESDRWQIGGWCRGSNPYAASPWRSPASSSRIKSPCNALWRMAPELRCLTAVACLHMHDAVDDRPRMALAGNVPIEHLLDFLEADDPRGVVCLH
jgi:hypothetical protein